jgi:DNA-binding transcriptional ArsR family regulator
MVRRVPNQAALNDVFRSLADPTRRAVIARLGLGPLAVTELARPFKMALPSFAQHLDVLEDCGLVRSHKAGRVRTYHLVTRRLVVAHRWLESQQRIWDRRLDQLDATLLQLKETR